MRNLRRFLCLFLSLVMVLSLAMTASADLDIEYTDENGKKIQLDDFLDTGGHWAHDVILRWAEYGLLMGYDGKFRPNDNITRADLAVVLDRMLGLKDTTYNYFSDVKNSAYYADSLLKCVAYGYLTGTSETQMTPTGYATREQVAAIICRVFNLDLVSGTAAASFKDYASIAPWARSYVATVNSLGYMTGAYGEFRPTAYITRAELVQALANVAGAFIPKRGGTQATSFRDDFPQNIVTGKTITLDKSSVGRDVFVTTDAGSFIAEKSEIKGRLVAMGKTVISLEETAVGQIVLLNGKSTVTGITKQTPSVYIAYNATESNLDDIPAELILESGTRVRIGSTVYENDSLMTKVYYGVEIKADIAAEQGYVTGGAKVSGARFSQNIDNVISVERVNITPGDSEVVEVGVVWVYQDSDENDVLPTYQNYDGIMKYASDKIDTTLSFNVGTVSRLSTYRLYVKDADGLFAYSGVETFSPFDFSVSMKVTDTVDNKYPEKCGVEVILQGSNVPEIKSIRVTYSTTSDYSATLPSVSMKEYEEPNAEVPVDPTKYQRFLGTVSGTKAEGTFIPPTYFGYIIEFKDGTIRNRFPVLSDVVPSGVASVADLKAGSATIRGDSLRILGSSVTAGYTSISEAGIMYYVGASQPSTSANVWTKVPVARGVGAGEVSVFDASVPQPGSTSENTYYAVYALTSSGYAYSEVSYFDGSWLGDEGASSLAVAECTVLAKDTVVVALKVTGDGDIDPNNNLFGYVRRDGKTVTSLGSKQLSDFAYHVTSKDSNGVRLVYIVLENLTGDAVYSLGMRLVDEDGLSTNLIPVSFITNSASLMSITLSNKHTTSYVGWTGYDIAFGNSSVKMAKDGSTISGDVDGFAEVSTNDGTSKAQRILYVKGVDDYTTTVVDLACVYTIPSSSVSVTFHRDVPLF